MALDQSRARSRVQELVSAWLAGDYDAVALGCTPDVQWWTPLDVETAHGPAGARAVLQRVLGPLPRPITVTALVPSEDGTRCVVEMRSAATAEDTSSGLVTSVLTLRDGKVAAGRTYLDVHAPGREHPELS